MIRAKSHAMDTLRDKHYARVTNGLIQLVPAHIKAGIDTKSRKAGASLGISKTALDTGNKILWRHAAWVVYSHRFDVPENLIKNLPHLQQHFEQLRMDGEVRRAIRNWYIDVEEEAEVAKGLVNRDSPEITRRNAETYKGNVLWAELMIKTTPMSFSLYLELLYHLVKWQSYIIQVESM